MSEEPLDIEPIVTDSANPLTLPEDPITVDEPEELAKRDIEEAKARFQIYVGIWLVHQSESQLKKSFENGSKRRNRRSVEFFPYDTPPEDILETLKELDAEPPIDIYVGDELVAENVTDVSKLVADDVTATSPKPLDMELMDPIIDKYDGLTTFLPIFPAQS